MTQHLPKSMLDELISLDELVSHAYYDMGRILSAIRRADLFLDLGYDSMRALVEEELSYSYETARKYARTYEAFKTLGYSRTEAMKLIREFSFTKLSKVLPDMRDKVGIRAIWNRIDKLNVEQLNFTISKDDHEIIDRALRQFGATVENGHWVRSSSALVEMAKAVTSIKRSA